MPDLPLKLAVALVFATGIATLLEPLQSSPLVSTLAEQHHQALLALLGAALALAPWLRSLQLPAVTVAIVAKTAFLAVAATSVVEPASAGTLWAEAAQVLALLAAGAILVANARREARWNGVRALRQGG